MSSKLVLDMYAATDDFFSDTAMIGIGCAMAGHSFCHIINRAFDFNFLREPEYDIEYKPAKDDTHFFSLYQYEEPHSSNKHLLYKLKSEKNALLPEIKQLDFLWLIQCQLADVEAIDIARLLRNFPQVQLAQIIPTDRLKNLDHLLI